MKTVCLIFLVTVISIQKHCYGYRTKGVAIAARAREEIGSRNYPYASSFWDYVTGEQYKGHLFVADVLKGLGVLYPKRHLPAQPVFAEEWADPRSPGLQILSMCWRNCPDQPLDGDIIAYDGIVGISTGTNRITLSDPDAKPRGLVVEIPSKYVPGKHGLCWRYMC